MKRFVVSLVLVFVATVSGVAASLNPATVMALESNRYVALGDSVAAGAGLPPGIGIPEEQGCARSEQAYPYRVAASLGMSLEHLACSGAKVDEGLYGPQEVNGTKLEAQLDRAFAAGTPDLITITIGANDARWSQFVRDCYTWQCGSSWDDLRISTYLFDLRLELYVALTSIKERSGNAMPKVLFSGYFTALSPTAPSCGDTRNFTGEEIAWLNTQTAALNQAIHESVSWFDFAEYAPLNFAGHELCTANPWIQGLQDPAPFHPTAGGQAAIARTIVGAARTN